MSLAPFNQDLVNGAALYSCDKPGSAVVAVDLRWTLAPAASMIGNENNSRAASQMGLTPPERINGWKSIAAYLGRDRSTVIRWAKERALPVHALPGGKSRTVYAMREELEAWMRRQGREPSSDALTPASQDPQRDDAPPDSGRAEILACALHLTEGERVPAGPPNTKTPRAFHKRPNWRHVVAAGGMIGVTVAVLAASARIDRTPVALDTVTTARLAQARDDLATRSEGRLNNARATLTRLAARHPDNAAIHEALAEAWILAREYGSEPDALAFDRARAAAATVRRIDPGSAVADRVEGAAAYWWDRDPTRAGVAFRRAIARAPQHALAHLWYANILADNGEDVAASREFTTARMFLPGAPYLLADYAWGLWSAGREAEAIAQLTAISAYTTLASVPDCLSVIALAKGDVVGYARFLRTRAEIRRHAELTAYSEAVDHALALGGEAGRQAAFAVMLSRGISLAENAERPDHSWPAFVAHVAEDRAELFALLQTARARGEHWGAAGFVRRMRVRWGGDAAILRELDALAQPRIERLETEKAPRNSPAT